MKMRRIIFIIVIIDFALNKKCILAPLYYILNFCIYHFKNKNKFQNEVISNRNFFIINIRIKEAEILAIKSLLKIFLIYRNACIKKS